MQKHKSILVVAESIDINDSSGTKGRVALIKNLKKVGFNVKVLHYTRRAVELEDIDCVAIKENKYLLYLFSRIRRVFNRHFKFDAFKWSEYILGFSFEFFNDSKSIAKSIKKHCKNYDLILTLSKGLNYRTHHAMLRCPNFYTKWAAYVHDPYPYTFFPPPYSWKQPGYKEKEKFFLKVSEYAKYSVFPSKLLIEWMGQFYPNFLKTGLTIPHQNLEVNINETISFPDYFDPYCFNILHAGNLLQQRSPIGLIEGFKLFLEKKPEAKEDAKLILIGHSDYFKKQLKVYGEELVQLHVLDHISFQNVNHLQNNSCINVILESTSDISPFLPGKFPHCAYADKPILLLGPKLSEVRRLLGSDYEFSANSNDVETIAVILGKLYENWILNNKNLKLNRPDIINYLGLEYLKKQFDAIFEKN